MQKLTTENFIKRAKIIHGDKYDYSNSEYLGAKKPIIIFCNKCKSNFTQQAGNHISKSQGCHNCYYSDKTTDYSSFLIKTKNIHGNKYDYSKVNYINSITKVSIICNKHCIFKQTPHMHLQGKGCPMCNGGINDTVNQFSNKAKNIHGDRYNYSKVNYVNSLTKVQIICDKHGIFNQKPNEHLQGKGCPICRESKGEMAIRKFLTNNQISFIPQYKFKNCYFKKELPFDFYLPDYNMCIEYNGRQHYTPVSRFGGVKGFELTQIRDKIKSEYCVNNKIPLIIFKYSEPLVMDSLFK